MITFCFSFQGNRTFFKETQTSPDVYHSKPSMFDCEMPNPNVGEKSVMTKRKKNIFEGKVCFISLQISKKQKQMIGKMYAVTLE
jgi:hypothetical protein